MLANTSNSVELQFVGVNIVKEDGDWSSWPLAFCYFMGLVLTCFSTPYDYKKYTVVVQTKISHNTMTTNR